MLSAFVMYGTSGSELRAVERRCKRIRTDTAGILFSSCGQTSYLSMDVHRAMSATRHQKSVWAITRPDECHVFCVAEGANWLGTDGNCWAISPDGEVSFGTRGERMAFFWSPANATDPWHGFPVGGRRGMRFKKSPPDELVEQWHKEGLISYTTFSRIVTRRV